MYPVFYKNKKYYKKDCDSVFLSFYNCIEALNYEGMVYMCEKIWIAPNGDMIED